MTVQTFYRCAVWLPLVVPALVAAAVHALGVRPGSPPLATFVQLLLGSLLYGGLPYAALAAWATVWIDRRPEPEIRRRALQAPLWMLAAWIPFAAFIGVRSGRLEIFAGLAGLGAAAIVPVGYGYVALVLLLRHGLGRAGWLATPASGHLAASAGR